MGLNVIEETFRKRLADVLEHPAGVGREQIHYDSHHVPRDHVVLLPVKVSEKTADERGALVLVILLEQQLVYFGRQGGEQLGGYLRDFV